MRPKSRVLACAVAITLVGASSSTPAVASYGYCMEPRAPSAAFIVRPTKPICYNGCSEWQVSSYKREIGSYLDNLQQYANDVDRYYKKAGEYIQCMSDLD
jgi:hypothetical protein